MMSDAFAAYREQRRDPQLLRRLLAEIETLCAAPPLRERQITVMEVCGTHTAAIHQAGLKQILPANLRLVSGPGCPVCVTPARELARALQLARQPGVLFTSFGDMLRVPVGGDSLLLARDQGAEVRLVVSPLDALALAEAEPDKQVVFLAVGFETTAPLSAACVQMAQERGLTNFSIAAAHRTMPQALRQLLAESPQIDALLCPGHVAAVAGADYFAFLAADLAKPAVIAGFEPVEIMAALLGLVRQLARQECRLENAYARAVQSAANPYAWRALDEVFTAQDAEWRGLGLIPDSGLGLRAAYAAYDAWRRFEISAPEVADHPACQCGAVLRGALEPWQCPLFGRACTPQQPQGACMVSAEGSCAAAYRYQGVT